VTPPHISLTNNTTGVSPFLSLSDQFDKFREAHSLDLNLLLLSLLIDANSSRVRTLERQRQDMVYLQKGLSLHR
jgi:hypothetical protein